MGFPEVEGRTRTRRSGQRAGRPFQAVWPSGAGRAVSKDGRFGAWEREREREYSAQPSRCRASYVRLCLDLINGDGNRG